MSDALMVPPTDRPRTLAAQDASWARWGNGNDYMRMIEAYAFASELERECAHLRALLHDCLESEFGVTDKHVIARVQAALATQDIPTGSPT